MTVRCSEGNARGLFFKPGRYLMPDHSAAMQAHIEALPGVETFNGSENLTIMGTEIPFASSCLIEVAVDAVFNNQHFNERPYKVY